jgi:hypothetical protein
MEKELGDAIYKILIMMYETEREAFGGEATERGISLHQLAAASIAAAVAPLLSDEVPWLLARSAQRATREMCDVPADVLREQSP